MSARRPFVFSASVPPDNGPPGWYKIVNHSDNSSADVLMFDEIGTYGIGADNFIKEIGDLQVSALNLRINSPGGDVFDGVAIYNALKQHKAKVHVTVEGLAASAASFIAMAGDTITMRRGSQMMIHDPYTYTVGNAAELRKLADNLDRTGQSIAAFYAERAGGGIEDWRNVMLAETWYSGEEAVAAGLADSFEGLPKDGPAPSDGPAVEIAADRVAPLFIGEQGPELVLAVPARTWDLSIFTYAGRDHAPPPTVAPPPEPAPPTTEQPVTDEAPEDLGGFTFSTFVAALTGGGPQ